MRVRISDVQAAMLHVQLAALGQVDLSDNDRELLLSLEYLLGEALSNVRKALNTPAERREEDAR